MTRPRTALVTLLLLFGILAASVVATYRTLPDLVASHFSAGGRPDAWMSRPANAAFTLGGAALVAALCAGPLYLTRLLPDSTINIPNRAYWLAPDRRDEAHCRMLAFGLWLAALSVGLFIGLHLLTVRANRLQPVHLPMTYGLGLVAAFLLGVGYLCFGLRTWFWRVEPSDLSRAC
jgi:uncharacterized membrane protein